MDNEVIEIQEKIGALFSSEPAIGIVYLFGSRARGEADSRSDYDFGVYLSAEDPVQRGNIQAHLISELTKKLGTDSLDAVILNDIESPELKYNIIREGIVLFEREPYRVVIEPRILNDYFDFMYLMRKYHLTTA